MASASSGIRKISFSKENKVAGIRGNLHLPLTQRDFTPKVPSPLTIEIVAFPSQSAAIATSPNVSVSQAAVVTSFTSRPEYKRTMSTKIGGVQERINYGHRRTQSLNMPQTQINPYGAKNDLRKSLYNRSSSNIANTREFYAAPAYNEASLLQRQESMRLSTKSAESVTA